MISTSSPIFKHHRTMPADDAPLAEIDNNDHYAVHEYKKCMEDIKRDNPNLATGAIQKMALERCGAMIHEEEQHRGRNNKKHFAEPAADLLRGVMSKLRLGGKGNNRTKSVSVAEEEDEVAGTISSSTDKPNEEFVVRRGRSIAARKSVACSISSEEREAVAQLSGDISDSEDDDEESLSNSLHNIEKQQFCPEKRRSRRSLLDSKRGSTRASEISLSLSDVEEDVETKPSNKGVTHDLSSISKGEERRQASLSLEESVTKFLPVDEIKVLLNNFGAVATDKNNHENSTSTANAAHAPTLSARQQQGGNVQKEVQNNDERSSNNSSYTKLSVLSVDSDTFGGDFSAWASARRLSNCSSTT